MKLTKCLTAAMAALLFVGPLSSVSYAETDKTIVEESIYDVLVDRYFNKSAANDLNVDRQDATQFAGGDFLGLVDHMATIQKMGFTIVSLGSVFATDTYDGWSPTSYSKIEPHFGTDQELAQLIGIFNKERIAVMTDFPLSNVSTAHEWAQDPTKKEWIQSTENGRIQWDLSNKDVQEALKEALAQWVKDYSFGGIRLTNIAQADTAFLNELIDVVKKQDPTIYVITNEVSEAKFDAAYTEDAAQIYRNMFKTVDLPTENFVKNVEPFLANEQPAPLLMLDSLQTDRFVYAVTAEKMFPPTRLKTALLPVVFLPGVFVMQYGTEIAMNGIAGGEAHQIYNFKTDEELVDYISDLQKIRQNSEAMRTGDFLMLANDDGLIAYTRKSSDEHMLVIANNTSKTKNITLTGEDIGDDKELRGLLSGEIVKQNKNGDYVVILDREVADVYQIIDKRGWNYTYIAALAIVYILFMAFVIAIVRKDRKQRKAK